MNMAERSDIWIFSQPGTPIASLLARLPHARILTTEPQAERPRFAIVQIETEQDCDLVWDFVKSKTPVALAFPNPRPWMVEKLRGLSRTAQHNRVPVVALGSWRYIPAVAALKEIASSGVLGDSLHLDVQADDALTQALFAPERLADLGMWLTGESNGELATLKEVADLPGTIRLKESGTNGCASTSILLPAMLDPSFRENGKLAATTVNVEIADYSHARYVPSGNPDVSEYAVLGLSLDGISGKIKALPALMPFWA